MSGVWNDHVVKTFQLVDQGSKKEKVYYPAYNKLLYSEFPADSNFTIAPQTYPLDSIESIDYVLEYEEYVIFDEAKSIPVFILEVKPKQSLDSPSARDVADRQIRSRFNTLLNDYPFEEFYGVSAFGPKICIYKVNKITGDIQPSYVPKDYNKIDKNPPIERWANNDITEVNCARQLKLIFNKIKTYCETDNH